MKYTVTSPPLPDQPRCTSHHRDGRREEGGGSRSSRETPDFLFPSFKNQRCCHPERRARSARSEGPRTGFLGARAPESLCWTSSCPRRRGSLRYAQGKLFAPQGVPRNATYGLRIFTP